MEPILKCLRRQKTVTDESQLVSIIHATENGTVFDPPSLRLFARQQFGVDPNFSWAKNTWKHLAVIKRSVCTDIVECAPTEDEPSDPLPPSMMELTCAMKNLMYKDTHLPIVAIANNTKLNKHRDAEFDRNDWFLTNAGDMERLVSEERDQLESRICLVYLHTHSGRKYVTWCQRKHVSTFREHVNHEQVILNHHATTALRKGDIFVGMVTIDDDIGQLRERDVMDNLYYMETHIGKLNSRHPRGLNLTDANHMVHRSLRIFGGDWGVLEAYGKWDKNERKLADNVRALEESVQEVIQARKGLARSTVTDDEIRAAMRAKIGDKLEDVQSQLSATRSRFKHARTYRADLNRAIVENMAECVLNERPVSSKLSAIRKELSGLPTSLGAVGEDAKGLLAMNEDRALKILGLVDAPVLDRGVIRSAWKTTQKLYHTDKTLEGRVSNDDEFANVISCARDFLVGLYSGEESVVADPIQASINSIRIDICL
jgi:hypothetical protein